MKIYFRTVLVVTLMSFSGVSAHTETDTAELQLSVHATSSGEAKGNVETGWKVEEGQRAGPALLEIDTIRGESPDAPKAEPALLKIDRNDESNDESKEPKNSDIRDEDDDNDTVLTKDEDLRMSNAVSVQAVTVRGWDPKQKQEFLATVKTHAQVQSSHDLEDFAKGVLLKDENIEELSSDDTKVEVRYRVPAKFLGIFETTLPVNVVAVKAKGSLGAGVTAHFPWYTFLYGVKEEIDEQALEAEVGAAVITDLNRDGVLDVLVTARLYNSISNVLKTKHDTVKNSINNVR